MRPKVRTLDWWGPSGVLNVVNHSCPSLMQIWLYPDFMSNFKKIWDPFTWSMIWSICGSGYAFRMVMSLSFQ